MSTELTVYVILKHMTERESEKLRFEMIAELGPQLKELAEKFLVAKGLTGQQMGVNVLCD